LLTSLLSVVELDSVPLLSVVELDSVPLLSVVELDSTSLLSVVELDSASLLSVVELDSSWYSKSHAHVRVSVPISSSRFVFGPYFFVNLSSLSVIHLSFLQL
jgi:hypothetical protein